jgi:hypothetical protein
MSTGSNHALESNAGYGYRTPRTLTLSCAHLPGVAETLGVMRPQLNKSRLEVSVRIWFSIALQIVLFLAVLPNLAKWRNIEREIWSEFLASSLAIVAIAAVVPTLWKSHPVTRVLVAALLIFPVLILWSVLMEFSSR